MTAAWTRLVIRAVSRGACGALGLEGGNGLLDKCTDLCVGPVDGLLAGGEAAPSAVVRETDRAACTLVALVYPAGDAGLGECLNDAVLGRGPYVVDGAGQGW